MAWKFYDTNGNLKTTGSGGGGAAVAYENEVNIFTELNEFKDIEFTDQDATPVANRRLRNIDGLIRAVTTGQVEGRYLSNDSLELMVGADGVNAGQAGAVPAPAATDNTKFLKGDGTWDMPAGGTGNVVLPGNVQGRLTLESGVPISISDQIARTTLYLTPYLGNHLSLYDGANWNDYPFTERNLSLNGLIKGVLYDIFIYDSAGTLTLEAVAWKKVTASNNPTAGSNKVINLADTDTLAVGMEVTVKDGTSSEIATITAVVANTSITVAALANAYTTPDIYGYQARAIALALQNGVEVRSGDTTRLYLGTIRITGVTGQCEDSQTKRFVWNRYHRVERKLRRLATGSWTYGTAAYRAANNSTANRIEAVIGLSEDPLSVHVMAEVSCAVGGGHSVGIGVNSITVNSADLMSESGSPSTVVNGETNAHLTHHPNIGHVYYQWLEYSRASTGTFYGTISGAVSVQSGIRATMKG